MSVVRICPAVDQIAEIHMYAKASTQLRVGSANTLEQVKTKIETDSAKYFHIVQR